MISHFGPQIHLRKGRYEYGFEAFCLVVIAASLLVLSVSALSPALAAQSQTPQPAQSRSDEMLRMWNAKGNKLVVMAQDFPEDKYDFKVQKDERTFALNLLMPPHWISS